MNYGKRIGALLLILVLLVGVLPMYAAADENGLSLHGAFATEWNGSVYAALFTGTDNALYAVPNDGGELKQIDRATELGELVPVSNDAVNGLFYLRTKDGVQQVMRLNSDDTLTEIVTFESGVAASNLSWYDDVLYILASNQLYIVDPNGDLLILSDVPMSDYVIVGDVIFYISDTDLMSYERTVTGQDTPLKQTSGTLWSMSYLGTNPEKILDKGVTDLRGYSNYLFFHNLEDNYVMGGDDNVWLEGKLYRYNIETAQMASLGLNYDWDYYPTDLGLVIYRSQDISICPLTGGDETQLMTPEARTNLTAVGQTAYVYEYTAGKLTKLPLDGSPAITLSDDSDVLPSVTDKSLADDLILVDDETGTDDESGEPAEPVEDETFDDSNETTSTGTSSSYIFPNSSRKKLTRKQILAVKKSLWGYARNEIYARHGYVFKKSIYKNYFAKKTWYKAGGFSTSSLNSIEWYNMELIKSLEHEYGLLEGTSTSTTSSTANSSAKNNYYVLKEASSRKLTKKYIKNKLGSKSKYALARNEILARHGYVFKTATYKKYFNNQKWYKPGGYSSGSLSNIEWHNIEILKQLENS